VRVGVIGAGLQARRRAPVLIGLPDTELKIVTASDLESARPLADRLGCEAGVGWHEVVERDDIDAVIVCTPPDSHADISIAAMRNGKHVLCEKPLTKTVAEAEAMVAAAKETGRVLKCGFNHRFHPGMLHIRKLFEEGRIGEPLFVRARYGIGARPDYKNEWRADPSIVGGGQLMEQGIHAIDLARWFLGDFIEVACFAESGYIDIAPLEDNAFAMFRTAKGALASVHSSLVQWRNIFSFEIGGTEGHLAVEGLGGGYGMERALFSKKDLYGPFAEEVTDFRGDDRSWLTEWKEFAAAVDEGRAPLGDGHDGLETLRLVYAAYEASSTRRTVPFTPSQH
jgi:predicted dehydrogenase